MSSRLGIEDFGNGHHAPAQQQGNGYSQTAPWKGTCPIADRADFITDWLPERGSVTRRSDTQHRRRVCLSVPAYQVTWQQIMALKLAAVRFGRT